MQKKVAIGISNFEEMVTSNIFYIDKTYFIKDWWESFDKVTLITRPRRFGKTLTLNMVETFLSNQYANRGELFEGFSIWEDVEFREMQGMYPVINVSLADVKENNYDSMVKSIKNILVSLYKKHIYLLDSEHILSSDKKKIQAFIEGKATMEEYRKGILYLSECLYKHFDKKVIILIDEYDTPMLEAYVEEYWDEAIKYIRRMFHAAFKDNPYLERGLMTGITRITQESIFSDLNNLSVATITRELYEMYFGFTEEEVFTALEKYGLSDKKDEVKHWYDGFQFGKVKDIYNPWSIINYLKFKKFEPYWMNTSSNSLVGKLVQQGSIKVKKEFEILIQGNSIITPIDEFITYAELTGNSKVVWSWFLTTGYVKIVSEQEDKYEIALTNDEVRLAFYKLVEKWFADSSDEYSEFVSMLLSGNLEGMQEYMSEITEVSFSCFDVGSHTKENKKAEQFYHGFTLGLLADLHRTHVITSNRESGLGRYDVCIEPLDKSKDGMIIEFKVFDAKREQTLEETARRALEQIEEKKYETDLKARGIEKVRKYGFAFKGKEVLIME